MTCKKKICVVTGSRAEYGLLKSLMKKISENEKLELQILVTGMHLSSDYGSTYQEIENDGFHIDLKVSAEKTRDNPIGISDAIGQGVAGCARAFAKLNPDLVVLLGDRFEIFAAATAALISKVPIAHLHGGESTVGAYDEAFRHSITKMSHLHFVAAEEYRKRVIQLGEDPRNVFLVGGLGVDAIYNLPLLAKPDLEKQLGFKFNKKNLLITFHPITLENNVESSQFRALLTSLSSLKDTNLIFTLPNIDNGSGEIRLLLESYAKSKPNTFLFSSMGQLKYLSCMAYVDAVVGNSSSGIAEAPTFKTGTINIGSRQQGRLFASSVINCEPNSASITLGLKKLYTSPFQESLKHVVNPYGSPGASERIVQKLCQIKTEPLRMKVFYDL